MSQKFVVNVSKMFQIYDSFEETARKHQNNSSDIKEKFGEI